jgi:hypothetical protein
MNQIKFIWLSKNIPGVSVSQDPDGVTIVNLRPLIDITHDSNKRDKIEIIFKDDNTKYTIPNKKSLEEIYRMHLENEEVMLLLHQYCDTHLARC